MNTHLQILIVNKKKIKIKKKNYESAKDRRTELRQLEPLNQLRLDHRINSSENFFSFKY